MSLKGFEDIKIDKCWCCGKPLGRTVYYEEMVVCDDCEREIEVELRENLRAMTNRVDTAGNPISEVDVGNYSSSIDKKELIGEYENRQN